MPITILQSYRPARRCWGDTGHQEIDQHPAAAAGAVFPQHPRVTIGAASSTVNAAAVAPDRGEPRGRSVRTAGTT